MCRRNLVVLSLVLGFWTYGAAMPAQACQFSIPVNGTVSGSWTEACTSTHRGRRYAGYYMFTLSSSAGVQIDLVSATDPYLYLLSGSGRNGSVLTEDDDGGDGKSSRIVKTLPAGTYTIEATTYQAGRTGSFTLSLRTTGSGCIAPLTLNATTSGTWINACSSTHRSGSYARYYTFSLNEETDFQANLSSSVNSYLYLLRGTGMNGSVVAQDDNSGGNNNARIQTRLTPGAYTLEATTQRSGQVGFFALRAGKFQGTTVFLVHGLAQGGGALASLGRTLSDPQFGIDQTRFRVDSGFDWGRCAKNKDCTSDNCEISNGGKALAQYINQRNPGGQIILIGYSLGGLISRDMVLNNYDNVISNRRVLALITLGSPLVGYPYCEIDKVAKCPVLIQQMASQYRIHSDENLVVMSPYLRDLNTRWDQPFQGRPGQWLAAAGSACSGGRRSCEWNAVDDSVNQGCLDNNSTNDGVVCSQSALYRLNASKVPSVRWSDDNYSHTGSRSSWFVLCGGGGRQPLFNPPANGTLVRAIRELINGLR